MATVEAMPAVEQAAAGRAILPVPAQYGLATVCGMAGSVALLFAGLPVPSSWWVTLSSLVFWAPVIAALVLALTGAVSRRPFAWIPERLAAAASAAGRIWTRPLGPMGLFAALIVCALPVASLWFTGKTTYLHIGGLLPWSDAAGYHTGGLHLLHEGRLDPWNMRRPLNASFWAVRLALTGLDYQWSLLLQAWLVAVSCFCAALAVRRTHGLAGGLLAFAALFEFARSHLGTAMSESLGSSFGCLGFALLWNVSRHAPSGRMLMAGMMFLTLGLHARAGAYLILPALLVWALLAAPPDPRARWQAAGWAGLGIGAATLANMVPLWLFGTDEGMAQANFSFTLYGLAAGGKGYAQVFTDHPEILHAYRQGVGRDVYDHVYGLAIDRLLADPRPFLSAYWETLTYYVGHLFHFVTEVRWYGQGGPLDDRLLNVVLGGLSCAALAMAALRSGDGLHRQLALASAGIALSAPFLIQDGGFRLLAATMPYTAALPAVGLAGLADTRSWLPVRWGGETSGESSAQTAALTRVVMVLGLALAGLCVLGPLAVAGTFHPPAVAAAPCAEGLRSVIVRAGSGSPFLDIVSAADAVTHAPMIREDDFRRDPSFAKIGIADALRETQALRWLMKGYDLSPQAAQGAGHNVWLLGGDRLARPAAGSLVQMCGEEDRTTHLMRVKMIRSLEGTDDTEAATGR